MGKIDDDKAKDIFCELTGYFNKSNLEVVEQEDRVMVWKSGGYGQRAYCDEVEIFNDGRVMFWEDRKPIDKTDLYNLATLNQPHH